MNILKHLLPLVAITAVGQVALADVKFNPLPDLGFGGTAYDLNEAGTIVGGVVTNAEYKFEPAVWLSTSSAPIVLPTGGRGGYASAVNSTGIVVGGRYLEAGSGSEPTVWVDGQLQVLPTLGDGGQAYDVNDNGQIVGFVYEGHRLLPALWEGGNLTLLSVPEFGVAGDVISSSANSINNAGDILGTVKVDFGSDSLSIKWSAGSVSAASLPTWLETRGIEINSNGDLLVGGYFTPNGSFSLAQLSSQGVPTILPAPSEGATVWPTAGSDNGIAVGFYREQSTPPAPILSAAWRNGTIEKLELPAGMLWSFAVGVNNAGTVVGYVSDGVTGASTPGFWSLSSEAITTLPAAGLPGQVVDLTATVKRGQAALPGRVVRFRVGANLVGQATTNSQGIAKVRYVIPAAAAPGVHTTSSQLNSGLTSTGRLGVNWVVSALSIPAINAAPGQAVAASATLFNNQTKAPLINQLVSFEYGGRTFSARTNGQGRVSIPFNISSSQARNTSFSVVLRYAGNNNHRAASGRLTVNVK